MTAPGSSPSFFSWPSARSAASLLGNGPARTRVSRPRTGSVLYGTFARLSVAVTFSGLAKTPTWKTYCVAGGLATGLGAGFGSGFGAGVALYPNCEHYSGFYSPLLILIGGADDWTPAVLCEVLKVHSTVELKVYRGAPHSFDNPGPSRRYLGHVLGYDGTATADARQRVGDFLGRYLRP